MADNDQKRRFLRNRGRSVRPTDAAIPPSSETAAPAGVPAVPQRRPARAQASQDVVALVGFLRAAENRRAQGRPAPTPKSMRDVLGAFRGQPAQQITIQVLAAAATTRHLGAQSQNTRRWEQLAQENAARLEALRAQQYRREQQRYVQVQMPPEEIARRTAENEAADRDSDKRAFDAAAALALSYVAAKSVPSFDKLAELSEQHLSVVEPTAEVPASVVESAAHTADEQTTTADTAAEMNVNVDKSTSSPEASGDTGPQTDMAAAVQETQDAEEAEVSDQLEHVPQAAQKTGADLDKIESALESAGRGLATAIGPIHGDDEVAPPLSPVDLNQLSRELLSAIGAAMSSHPRSVTEMLNIERRPDHTNETAFDPDMGVERSQVVSLGC
ncbi:hypothetical protein AAI421_28305 (plasmid) [Rhodococcus aetherivorans]|uniref:hypothetical protein n=1 Tax=Rhodococcus aetherivorans TaxID=191292 RepID=UPI0031D46BB5